MRKIFLDCGSNDGCSVRKFQDTKDKEKQFEYFCFEGNPKLFHYHPVDENCKFYKNIVYGSKDQIDFESSLKKLEDIVSKLENTDINLEDSVQSFEEGIKLVKDCQKQLSDAELKVKKLLENGNVADLEDK